MDLILTVNLTALWEQRCLGWIRLDIFQTIFQIFQRANYTCNNPLSPFCLILVLCGPCLCRYWRWARQRKYRNGTPGLISRTDTPGPCVHHTTLQSHTSTLSFPLSWLLFYLNNLLIGLFVCISLVCHCSEAKKMQLNECPVWLRVVWPLSRRAVCEVHSSSLSQRFHRRSTWLWEQVVQWWWQESWWWFLLCSSAGHERSHPETPLARLDNKHRL